MSILFCRIGWCNRYNGDVNDKPIGGGAYNKKSIGHEIYNFSQNENKYYGYVEASRGKINLEKLDSSNLAFCEKVLVVWVANNKSAGRTVVVGWYENAVVYSSIQKLPENILESRKLKDHDFYNIFSEKAVLLLPEERTFEISHPFHNYWFGDESIREKVLQYISNYNQTNNKVTDIDVGMEDLLGDEREILAKFRINQTIFREQLINKYKKCCLCGLTQNKLLIASHIKPWSKSDSKEKVDSDNGFLLCPTHDKLFDLGFISFENDGSILISKEMNKRDLDLLALNGAIKIEISDGNKKYLDYHRKNIFRK